MSKLVWMCATLAVALVMGGCQDGGGGGSSAGPAPATSGPVTGKDLHFANVMAMPLGDPGAMEIHATVRYRDSDGATATAINYQLRRESGAILGSGTIAQLEPGESRMLMIRASGIADRERLIVAVDTANTITEVLENNNTVQVTAVFAEQPTPTSDIDLSFGDSHYHGTYYYRDPRFHFFIHNPNTRGADVANVKVAILANGVQVWSTVYDRIRAPTSAELAANDYPGKEITLGTAEVFGTSAVATGRYVLTIIIDPDNSVAETNEANNFRRLIVEVDEAQSVSMVPTDVPDIQLEDPHFHQFTGRNPNSGYVLWHFWVSNISNGTEVRQVPWRLVHEDGRVINTGTTAVGPQQLSEVIFSTPKDGDAETRYRLEFDPDNVVIERDESNNAVGFIVDWTPESSG